MKFWKFPKLFISGNFPLYGIIDVDYTYLGVNNTSIVSQGNNCSLNVFQECINSGLEWWNSGLEGLALIFHFSNYCT